MRACRVVSACVCVFAYERFFIFSFVVRVHFFLFTFATLSHQRREECNMFVSVCVCVLPQPSRWLSPPSLLHRVSSCAPVSASLPSILGEALRPTAFLLFCFPSAVPRRHAFSSAPESRRGVIASLPLPHPHHRAVVVSLGAPRAFVLLPFPVRRFRHPSLPSRSCGFLSLSTSLSRLFGAAHTCCCPGV